MDLLPGPSSKDPAIYNYHFAYRSTTANSTLPQWTGFHSGLEVLLDLVPLGSFRWLLSLYHHRCYLLFPDSHNRIFP